MLESQKVILVADQESLVRTYDFACAKVESDIPTMMAGAFRLGMSSLGLSKIVGSKKGKEKITGKHIALFQEG